MFQILMFEILTKRLINNVISFEQPSPDEQQNMNTRAHFVCRQEHTHKHVHEALAESVH